MENHEDFDEPGQRKVTEADRKKVASDVRHAIFTLMKVLEGAKLIGLDVALPAGERGDLLEVIKDAKLGATISYTETKVTHY